MRKELAIEAGVVGLSTLAVGMTLSKTLWRGSPPYGPLFWFALGAATHVGWEALGGNRWYVETRDPKQLPKGLLV